MPYQNDRRDDRLNAWDGVDDWDEVCPLDDDAAAEWMAIHFPDDDEFDALDEVSEWLESAESSDCVDPTVY